MACCLCSAYTLLQATMSWIGSAAEGLDRVDTALDRHQVTAEGYRITLSFPALVIQ